MLEQQIPRRRSLHESESRKKFSRFFYKIYPKAINDPISSNAITSSNFFLSFPFIEKVIARCQMVRQRGQNLFVSCCLSEMFLNMQRQEATEDCSMLVQRRRSLQFLRSTKPVNIFLIIVKWN